MHERIGIFRELTYFKVWSKVEYPVYNFRINQDLYHNIQMSNEVRTIVIEKTE